jgi:lipoprotein NlpD
MARYPGLRNVFCLVLLVAFLTACGARYPAPVEDRRTAPPRTATPTQRLPAPPIYEVRRGDTLYSLAFRFGLDWREVARWNRIDAPYTIRPGQELRLSEPPGAQVEVRQRPQPSARSVPSASTTAPPDQSPPAATEQPAPQRAPAPASSAPARDEATRNVASISWRWPADGRVVRSFDPSATRRGIGISGQTGQAVVAAADGEVVYSGTALIGYGELIIIKHSGTMLSAYGHNRRRLVDEGVRVRGGQVIAEMGMNERDEVLLHFEIRRNGQAEDPLRFLPNR